METAQRSASNSQPVSAPAEVELLSETAGAHLQHFFEGMGRGQLNLGTMYISVELIHLLLRSSTWPFTGSLWRLPHVAAL